MNISNTYLFDGIRIVHTDQVSPVHITQSSQNLLALLLHQPTQMGLSGTESSPYNRVH